jgi:hypothetical protein
VDPEEKRKYFTLLGMKPRAIKVLAGTSAKWTFPAKYKNGKRGENIKFSMQFIKKINDVWSTARSHVKGKVISLYFTN